MENCKPSRLDGRTGNEKITKEFNLSEKIKTDSYNQDWLTPKDVKEFIRRLEEWIIHNKHCYQLGFEVVKTKELFEELDKLAGEDLIE
jgi:hypothetical protein